VQFLGIAEHHKHTILFLDRKLEMVRNQMSVHPARELATIPVLRSPGGRRMDTIGN
jgi:hypothetical protein